MARVSQATQRIVRAGLSPALTVPTSDGDVVDCGAVALMVDNASVGAVTVTVVSTAAQDGLDVADLAVVVPAGGTRLIGPLPHRTFGQPVSSADAGRAYVNYSTQSGVTRAVISL
ncbi:hypothetical protein [Micromonospora sp. RTGN7]|uniref:hypothetical protein n=1 Tax=Micromonospora sp. RTGN7 TaxID=3016526 RepID=UPI0029FF2FF3|nr:hypothetical protein [Micromonospora sp. RTGN7]